MHAGLATLTVAEGPRVFPQGQQPDDIRLKPLKDLKGHFSFAAPKRGLKISDEFIKKGKYPATKIEWGNALKTNAITKNKIIGK